MKLNSIVASIFALVLLLGSVHAATSTLNTFTVTPSNATVNANTTYNITLSYITLVNSLYSANITFPFDTRFNGTTVSTNVSQVSSNISGANANGSVNLTLVISNTTAGSEVDFVFNNSAGASLTIGNQYYITFTVTTTSNPRSANGSVTYGGFSAYALLYTINGTQSAGGSGNTSTYTLVPQNATNMSATAASGTQTIAVGTTTANNSVATYNLTVLVTDQFGNPYSHQLLNFSSLNTSSSTANLTLSLNGSGTVGLAAGGWYNTVTQYTNSTGYVSNVSINMGQSTLNSSSTVYQVRVINATAGADNGFTTNVTFNVTPRASFIRYYILTPSNSAPDKNASFNILTSSYDAFSNINGTSSWAPSMTVSGGTLSKLSYSTDGTTFTAYTSSITMSLSSGNQTLYFKHDAAVEGLTFTVGDTNQATGTTAITTGGTPNNGGSGGSGGGGGTGGSGGSTATPTPTATATPSATASASATAGAGEGGNITPTPTYKPSSTPTIAPTSTATEQPVSAGGVDPLVAGGLVVIVLAGAYYLFVMRKP